MTDLEQANRTLVEGIYAAAGRGDLAGVAAAFDPGIVLHQAASLPYGGEYRGRDATMAVLGEMFAEHFEVRALDVENVAVDGDLVIGCVTLRARVRRTGRDVVMPFRECFRIRNGLVVDLRPFYYDTAALAAAFDG